MTDLQYKDGSFQNGVYATRECKVHGLTMHALRTNLRWRCKACTVDTVVATRRKHRAILIEEAGGKCENCGYNRCSAALEFHHRDPATKEFGLSGKGQTYSLARKRAEAAKCALLCANCHRETEVGYTPSL